MNLSCNHYQVCDVVTKLLWCWVWKWSKGFGRGWLWLKLDGRGWVVSVENESIKIKWNGKKVVGGCLREDDCLSLGLGLGLRRELEWLDKISRGF